MAKIYPFRALRPDSSLSSQVASVPYDVVNRAEARALAADNPVSFLHVTKPEIDAPDDADVYSAAIYSQGATALRGFVADGVLKQDDDPSLYIYELTMGSHVQTGVVLCASVAEYDRNEVRKHEYTRPDKEQDRVQHMLALNAQSGTVFLVHRDSEAIGAAVGEVTAQAAEVDFVAEDGVRHRLWQVPQGALTEGLVQGFDAAGPLYIADGHHRSAAASRVAASRRQGDASDPALDPSERFLAVSFAAGDVQILPYNRFVHDLNGRTPSDFLAQVGQIFDLSDGKPEPMTRHTFAMFLEGAWYTLRARSGSFEPHDPVDCLDVSILQNQLLAPVLGIEDPRRDKRIDFVGGIRGDGELERLVQQAGKPAVAFALFATSMDELLAIADANQVMPPKSTWFEPKLRDGLVIHSLEV